MELNQYAERKSITKRIQFTVGIQFGELLLKKKQKNTKTFLGPNHHIVTYPISNRKKN